MRVRVRVRVRGEGYLACLFVSAREVDNVIPRQLGLGQVDFGGPATPSSTFVCRLQLDQVHGQGDGQHVVEGG